jgi:hypothetical protein
MQYGTASRWSRPAVIKQLFCMAWYWPDRERHLATTRPLTAMIREGILKTITLFSIAFAASRLGHDRAEDNFPDS